jgi:polyhydroxyalkanoate synthesis regulator phasin
MLEVIKKTVLAGIGFAWMSYDKAEDLAKTLVEKGSLTEKEGEKFIQDLMAKAEETSGNFEEQLELLIKRTMKKMNVATREDVLKLAQRVRKLEKEIKQKPTET